MRSRETDTAGNTSSAHTVKLVAIASSGHRATFDAILALRQAD